MNLRNFIIVKLYIMLFNYIYTSGAQNATHGNFSHALNTCKKTGGFAPRDIMKSLPLGHHQLENCDVAKSLELDDGESLWTHYRAELGAYIAPFSCAEKLPTHFKESVNSADILYECSKVCSRKESNSKITYVGIQNEECYCINDQVFSTVTSCQIESKLKSSTFAFVYKLADITVQREAYACITSIIKNNSRIYETAKCSGKHKGLCTCVKKDCFEVTQANCLNYNDTFDVIGLNFCILNLTMFKDDIDEKCLAYSAKMAPFIYDGMEKYLTNFSESFYLSSVRTFRIVDNAKFTFDNLTLHCVSLYKRGCTIFLEPDRCQNINKFRCQYTSISKEQTGPDTLIAILIPSASLLILAIFFVVRFNYMKRTRISANVCTQNLKPEIHEQEHVDTCMYEYETSLSVSERHSRRQTNNSISEDILSNEPSNTDPLPEKSNTIYPTEYEEYDLTTTSGREKLQ